MIDSNFIIRYTNALYSTDSVYSPRYNEFRDMFSSGQIKSKEWVVTELEKLNLDISTTVILGCWFGTLGLMIKNKFTDMLIDLVDIDPRCEKFNEKIFYDIPGIKLITSDMFNIQPTQDLLINTSCEHINFKNWLSSLPKHKNVLLQSNNYFDGDGHINCSKSLDDFAHSANLREVLYAGSLAMPMYTRYMIIGKT